VTESKPDLERAAAALNSGAIHLLRGLGAVDRLAGLTPARLSALSVLVFGGPSTLGALAAAEGVAGPTMTRIVDGLAGAGLAERRPHPDDGRAVEIAATSRGQQLMRDAARRRIEAIVAGLGRLTAAERGRLISAAGHIDRLAAAIRQPS
jgi:DNA-binding MarR family transcriptional regulator